jgi:hypothetical protein
MGSWKAVVEALRFASSTVTNAVYGGDPVRPALAFRVARLAGVGVDDLLAGRCRLPCPTCGHVAEPEEATDVQ